MDTRWLATVAEPLVQLSAPLDAPAPHYSRAADAVVATHAGMHLTCKSYESNHHFPQLGRQPKLWSAAMMANK